MRTLTLAAALAASPTVALACGGLFCNTTQPVNQAAERILFARDGERVQMHVRLTWSGPPQDFGWLLPVPPDVETTVSSEALFSLLDQAYGPQFQLIDQFEDCGDRASNFIDAAASPDLGAADAGAGGGVNVLSREQVGPYDRAILQGESVDELITWLTDNAYQVPPGAAETLTPYVELGAAFVAIKLVPGADSSEVVPLALSFTASGPAIPLRPTANAADPDMGVIVHILGENRAIPVNFRHVQINEAAIEWTNGGQNYPDVVSQAADEANGRAFATDYAGPVTNALPPVVDLARLGEVPDWDAVRGALNLADPDLQRVVGAVITDPGSAGDVATVLACPFCYEDVVVDGAALAARITEEINPPRTALADLFATHRYLTRLYTTLSPAEMDTDPIFDENPDLTDVSNLRTATRFVPCGEFGPDFSQATIETASGLRFRQVDGSNPDAIQRQDGQTVRGQDVPAAAVIEQGLVAGQFEILDDRRGTLSDRYRVETARGDDDCDGCSSTTTGGTGLAVLLLALFRPRRRVR